MKLVVLALVLSFTACGSTKPKPAAYKVVPASSLELLHGTKAIAPPESVAKRAKKLVMIMKVCVSVDGHVSSIETLRSSAYPAYDQLLTNKVREWRCKPFVIDGKPWPVCTAITFVYERDKGPHP